MNVYRVTKKLTLESSILVNATTRLSAELEACKPMYLEAWIKANEVEEATLLVEEMLRDNRPWTSQDVGDLNN